MAHSEVTKIVCVVPTEIHDKERSNKLLTKLTKDVAATTKNIPLLNIQAVQIASRLEEIQGLTQLSLTGTAPTVNVIQTIITKFWTNFHSDNLNADTREV